MKSWLPLKLADLYAERPAGADEDVHFPESLVAEVLAEYSAPGEVVLDPFAGFGTTLVVAERMGRRGIGIELLPERVKLIRDRLAGDAQVIQGDARQLDRYVTGPVDLCLTSPPYMTMVDHPENPLTGYETLDGDYDRYLAEIGEVFRRVAGLLRPGGYAVLNVANIREGGTFTPLAWDIGRVVSRHLSLCQETFLCWDRQPPEITGDYCLTFQKAG